MKIAIVAPPWLSVPPEGYGGTESVVHFLTEGLVKKGHDVTLFASGDSKTSAKLVSVFPKALGNSGELKNEPLRPLLEYIECFQKASDFDIIHNHAQYQAMFLADLVTTPVVHTIHGSFAKEYTPEGKLLTLMKFKDHKFVSISNAQRADMPDLNFVGTVYNGIDLSQFEFSDKRGEYLVWLGRIAAKKGPVDAIQVAKKLNLKLIIAAVIDPIDQEFFNEEVKPLIDNKLIIFSGSITHKERSDLLKNALCTLYPIHWNEPFGLVMAESMACGTPVIAFNRGSVSEILRDGLTGFIVEEDDKGAKNNWLVKKTGLDGFCEAIEKIQVMSDDQHKRLREDCRKRVEENFTVEKMVDGYEKIYEKLLTK